MSGRPSCPSCHQELPEPATEGGRLTERWPHFPFCSRRCRLLDLGNWLTGRYSVPGTPIDPEEPPTNLPRREDAFPEP